MPLHMDSAISRWNAYLTLNEAVRVRRLTGRSVDVTTGFIDLTPQRPAFFRSHPSRSACPVWRAICTGTLPIVTARREIGFRDSATAFCLVLKLVSACRPLLFNPLLAVDTQCVAPFLMLLRTRKNAPAAGKQKERHADYFEHLGHNKCLL